MNSSETSPLKLGAGLLGVAAVSESLVFCFLLDSPFLAKIHDILMFLLYLFAAYSFTFSSLPFLFLGLGGKKHAHRILCDCILRLVKFDLSTNRINFSNGNQGVNKNSNYVWM
jgi:hypothetical protein